MNISSNINGENVTIKNIVGDEKNSAIVYIDSNNNLVLKTEPIQNREKLIATSASEIVETLSGNYLPLSGGTLTGMIKTPSLSSTSISANKLDISFNGATDIVLSNSLIEVFDNVNSYSQINIQNQNSGNNASTDIVATSNTGTDASNYIDVGINGSGFNQASWTINGKNDGYVYTAGGNLSIGTSSSNKSVDIFAGGTLSANKIVSFNPGFYKISAAQIPVSYYNGQAGWNRRTIFSKFLGNSVNSVSEVDVMASATAGAQQIDGGYPGSLYGIPPIIRPNFLTSAGYWLRSHGMFGLNMGSNSSYVVIREYWGTVKVSEITIVKWDFPSPEPTSSNNFPLEIYNRYNWSSGPVSAARMRVHNTVMTGVGKGYVKCSESWFGSDYPIVNLTTQLPIRWTAQWSHSDCVLYNDNIEYEI